MREQFTKERCFIAKCLNIPVNKTEIDTNHPCGELVIFADGKYQGYLDDTFYIFMEDGVDMFGNFIEWKRE